MFLATLADGKQLLHGEKGRQIAKTHPESAFGWALLSRGIKRDTLKGTNGAKQIRSFFADFR